MKRLVVGIGCALMIAAFGASPAGAICYECRFGGQVCNANQWCWFLYTCAEVSGFCSTCWEDCYDNSDGAYCSWTTGCQWTKQAPNYSSPGFETPNSPFALFTAS